MDAAIAAVLSDVDDILIIKEEQRAGPKCVFVLLMPGFGKILGNRPDGRIVMHVKYHPAHR